MILLLLYWYARLLIGVICISWLQVFAKDHIITLCLSRRCIIVSVLVNNTTLITKVTGSLRWSSTKIIGLHLGVALRILTLLCSEATRAHRTSSSTGTKGSSRWLVYLS